MPGQLAIVERAHRGAVEKQYYDCLYNLRLHLRLGPLDVLLRGTAVTYAVESARTPDLRVGDHVVSTVSSPAVDLGKLMADGARVWVEETDVRSHGLTADLLLSGVDVAAAGDLSWASYDLVYYF
ncbi:hypothetical protein GCM10029964_083560 [Kibdelosporangium lantanae]